MIAFITLIYASFYFLVFGKFKLLQKNTRNISVFIGVGVIIIGSVVFAWRTFAPISPDARVVRYSVNIVPYVKSYVTEVLVEDMQPLKKGDVLWRMERAPFQARVDQLSATRKQLNAEQELNRINLARAKELLKTNAMSQYEADVQQALFEAGSAEIQSVEAQLANAEWDLEQTVVRAPSDGFPVVVRVRPGQMVGTFVGQAPMVYMNTEETNIIASFSQSASRLIQLGDAVDLVFSAHPGQVYAGTVTKLARFTGEAQLQQSNMMPTYSGRPISGRWPVAVTLDDPKAASKLPQGSVAVMAVYTDMGKPFHVISKVALRMKAWTGFLTRP